MGLLHGDQRWEKGRRYSFRFETILLFYEAVAPMVFINTISVNAH